MKIKPFIPFLLYLRSLSPKTQRLLLDHLDHKTFEALLAAISLIVTPHPNIKTSQKVIVRLFGGKKKELRFLMSSRASFAKKKHALMHFGVTLPMLLAHAISLASQMSKK